ncbi:MAG: hypothetical protein HY226_04645, partial [Candidatus Vogelbacteria bacterium]|nr:hypothetical protein [Candidatus Vogelbacteria bacterium]
MAVDELQSKIGTRRPFARRKQLEQDLEHVTQEMYRKNLELVQTNRTLSLLRTIDSLVLESQEALESMCTQIAQSVTSLTDFPMVALLVVRPHHEEELRPCGLSIKDALIGKGLDDIKKIKLLITTSPWFGAAERTSFIHLAGLSIQNISDFLNC